MIETNNMYHASYYLCEGLNISDVEKRHDNRLGETVYFSFHGDTDEHEDKIKTKFESGIAVCNIRAYLTSVVTIRSIMRSALNNHNNHKREDNNEHRRKTARAFAKD